MIVTWNENRIKVVAVPTKGIKAVLQPGNNEIPTKAWEELRKEVTAELKAGSLVEVNATTKTTKKKDADGKEIGTEKKVIEGKSFKELSSEKAEKIVENTFSLETLKAWKKGESRDSVRALILSQIELVEKHGEGKQEEG